LEVYISVYLSLSPFNIVGKNQLKVIARPQTYEEERKKNVYTLLWKVIRPRSAANNCCFFIFLSKNSIKTQFSNRGNKAKQNLIKNQVSLNKKISYVLDDKYELFQFILNHIAIYIMNEILDQKYGIFRDILFISYIISI